MGHHKSEVATNAGADDEPVMDRAAFLQERNAKIALSETQSLFIDKSLLTLSASALGLTLTFLHDHTSSDLISLAIGGITLLTLSLGTVLGSLYASQRSIDHHVKIMDEWCAAGLLPRTPHSKRIRQIRSVKIALWLNRSAAVTFGAGVIAVAIFVIENLGKA
ncbi:MAG TPA: hypothetical protein VHC39_12615 [Rhizomicrobium sp.]|nr:hypothetical protein [Rhizomicrobium sp.]